MSKELIRPIDPDTAHAIEEAAKLGIKLLDSGDKAAGYATGVLGRAPLAQVKASPNINPAGLLPAKRDYFLYEGSLTTPPCSETVAWHLLRDPIEVDAESVAAFAKLYPMNARPVQKLDRRFVLRSS
jgi:hypothetical protein